jgi:hypothetical protein
MLLLAVALSAVTAVTTVPAHANHSTPTDACPQTTAHMAVDRKSPPMKKLNELPPANMYKAVYRQIGGCEVPVVVRYNVGRR